MWLYSNGIYLIPVYVYLFRFGKQGAPFRYQHTIDAWKYFLSLQRPRDVYIKNELGTLPFLYKQIFIACIEMEVKGVPFTGFTQYI